MNNDLEQFSVERLQQVIEHLTASLEFQIMNPIPSVSHREYLAAFRIALAAKQAKPVNSPCEKCKGYGFMDSGGTQPWGEPISVECDCTTQQPAHTEQDGWIKCNNDLPLIGVEVQVYIPGNAQTGRPTVTAMARFVNRQGAPDYFWDKSTGKGGMTLDTSVTHWSPLAAAPKPESE